MSAKEAWDGRPYSPEMCALLDQMQWLYDVADLAKHRVIEYRLPRRDFVLFYWEVARNHDTPSGSPEYAGTPVRLGDTFTAIVEPR